MISVLDAVILAAAGVLAGLVGSAGGITSMVSYPALLAVGLPALPASVANNVAIVACWPGSAAASRPELRGRASWVRRWAAVAAVGGAAGGALLVSTPTDVFERVVPFLVAAGSLALLLEPRLTARRERRADGPPGAALPVGTFGLALYNGYFGAGAGVMTLTLMLVLVDARLPTANALKNMPDRRRLAGVRRRPDRRRLRRVGGRGPAGRRHARRQHHRAARGPPAPGAGPADPDRRLRDGARGRAVVPRGRLRRGRVAPSGVRAIHVLLGLAAGAARTARDDGAADPRRRVGRFSPVGPEPIWHAVRIPGTERPLYGREASRTRVARTLAKRGPREA